MNEPRILVGDRHDVRVGRAENGRYDFVTRPAYRPDPHPDTMGFPPAAIWGFRAAGVLVACALVAVVACNVARLVLYHAPP